tara:strand:+ start:2041 stop:2304 length:264 start_codon:yes stop_codon:yes gene_type:complete
MEQDSSTYERLTLQLIRQAVKCNKLFININKPSPNLLYINEGGGNEISFDQMLYNHQVYMDKLKDDKDSGIFIMIDGEEVNAGVPTV